MHSFRLRPSFVANSFPPKTEGMTFVLEYHHNTTPNFMFKSHHWCLKLSLILDFTGELGTFSKLVSWSFLFILHLMWHLTTRTLLYSHPSCVFFGSRDNSRSKDIFCIFIRRKGCLHDSKGHHPSTGSEIKVECHFQSPVVHFQGCILPFFPYKARHIYE